MFDYLLDENEELKKEFSKFLLEGDKMFIKELICPNELTDKWLHVGRLEEKSFLYEVIY